MHALINSLDSIFAKKAPQLPKGLKEFIVKVAPYLIIISLLITLVSLFGLLTLMLGAGALVAYAGYGGSWTHIMLALILAVIVGIMEVIAVPGLFKRKEKAWNLVFYAQLVSLLNLLLSFNIIGLIISALIGFYILFQVRSYYMGMAPMGEGESVPTPTPAPTSTPTPAQ